MRLVSLFLVLIVSLYANNTVSNLSGSLSVNNGALNYNVALNIPTGTAGVKPDISLHYNSNGGNGYYGQGWSLSGLSAISRCGSNLEFDGVKRGVKYTSEDNICLDGQRLVAVSGAKWSTGSEYRTQIESYSKITYDGSNFKVYTKNGDIKEYKLINQTWYLSSIKDRYSNAITYNYKSNSSEVYIDTITYSDNTIKFNYEDKLDNYNGYSGGYNIKITKRVDSLDIKNNGVILRNYNLSYKAQTSAIDKSLVTSISECSGGVCLESLKFTYSDIEYKFGPFENWGAEYPPSASGKQSHPIYSGSGKTFTKYLDVNGDGLPDRVHHHNYDKPNEIGYWVQLNTGDGFGPFENWGAENPPPPEGKQVHPTYSGSGKTFTMFLDVNGDGLPDRVHHHNYNKPNEIGYWVQLNTGSGFGPFENWGAKNPPPPEGKQVHPIYSSGTGLTYTKYLDVNGDGLPDRVHHHNYDKPNEIGYWVQLNTGDGFGPFENWGAENPPPPEGKQVHPTYSGSGKTFTMFLDVNGDGLPDRVHHHNYNKPNEIGYWVQLNTGSGFGPFENWGAKNPPPPEGKQVHPIYSSGTGLTYTKYLDVNGDGLPDRVHHHNYDKPNEIGYWVQLNTGDGFGPFENWGAENPPPPEGKQVHPTYSGSGKTFTMFLDVNGDGLPDRVHHHNYDKPNEIGYWVQLNTGSGFGPFENWGAENPPPPEGKQVHPIYSSGTGLTYSMYLDVNGDGLPDRVHHHNYDKPNEIGYWVQLNKSNSKNNLISITDSFRNETTIDYKRLTEGGIYTKYNDKSYPNKDIQNSMQVVSSVVAKTLTGENSNTSYTYEGLKTNLKGLGSLGFAKITSLNSLNNVKIETEYRQDYPFIGMVSKTTTYMDDEILSEASNTYDGTTNNGITKVYQMQSVSKSYQGNTLLSTVTTTNNLADYDSFGNVLKTTTTTLDNTTGEVFKKTINNTYTNNPNAWILARLISASVTHEAYGDTKTKISSFIYDETTGILKSEIIEPTSDKWLKKEYAYDIKGNRISETISGADIQTTTTKYTYDESGKYILSVENELGHKLYKTYDSEGKVKTISDANGLVTSYEYDNFGKKVKETRADGTYTQYIYSYDNSINGSYYKIETKTQGFSDSSVYYNSLGNVVATKKIGFDGKNIYTTQNYDKFGNIVKRSIPYFEGETPQYVLTEFDRYNRVVKTNNLGAVDYISYDKFTTSYKNSKNQIKTTSKNVLGKVVKVVDAKGSVDESIVTYKYDAIGNLVKTTDQDARVISLTYDIYGNKILQDDPDMGRWSYTYNSLGQLKTQTDAKAQTTNIAYDKLGRKTSESLSDGSISTWEYDTTKKGKLHREKKVDSLGKEVFKKEYTYDQYSRLKSTTTTIDNKVFTKSYSYDQYGRLKEKILPNSFKVINTYDNNGYLVSIKSPKTQIEDFDGTHFVNLIIDLLNSSELSYDEYLQYKLKSNSLNQKAKLYRDLAQANQDEQQTLLSAASQLEANALEYEYQANESLDLSNQHLTQANNYLTQANSYYSTGNTSIGDYYGELYNQYKAYSDYKQVLSQNYLKLSQEDNQEASDIELYSYISQYTNSLYSQTKTISDNLKLRTQQHNSNGEITNGYILDNSEFNYFYMALEYNSKGQAIKNIVGNGLVNKIDLNEDGTISNISTGYNSSNQIRDLSFEYDSLNNLIHRKDNKLNLTQDYLYDTQNRVVVASTTEKDSSNSILYDYDKSGNIIYKSDVGDYTYKANTHQVVKAGTKVLKYDQNGNILENGSTIFSYTPFNKTKTIITTNNTISFNYDINKQRYKKTQSKDSAITYYLDKSYEYISSSSGDKEKYFIYVNGKVVSIYTNDKANIVLSNTKYLHYDSLNSIDTITNNIGKVESRMAYSPFGKKLNLDKDGNKVTTAPFTNRGYTGHEHIEDTDYINMNARLYDSSIGRFMAADTMIPYMYNTQSYNRYSYVRNNPLKYIDPTGHWGFNPAKIVKKVVKAHVNVAKKVQAEAERFETKHRQELKVAAVVALSAYTGTWAMKAYADIYIAGALSGAVGGIAGVKINGGSWDDTFDAGLKGAVIGAISAGVANKIGDMGVAMSKTNSAFTVGTTKALAHGISRAAIAKSQGQDTSSAFWAGFLTSSVSPLRNAIAGNNYAVNVAFSATIGGTTSMITGGKFSNGAITGAFIYMFNDALHYDGETVTHTDDDGNIVGEYSATSGVPGSGSADQFTKGYGPIPEGSYTLNPSEISKTGFMRSLVNLFQDWGTYRVPLHIDGVVNHDRNGFFLHGGKTPGSAGCIDVGSNDVKLFNSIINHDGAISVTVKY